MVMWRLLTSWEDSSSHSQWNFNSGHSQDRWEWLDFLMPPIETMKMGLHREAWQYFSDLWEHSSKDGMSYGSLVDYESQKISRIVLSTTVAELYSFMQCFGSCQFRRVLRMNISGEVADIHMRTDAKNLVTTARTIHLLERKETIHMISMLRKEACSGSIHDLAHISTQNCLAGCLTKSSAKANNLITPVKQGDYWKLTLVQLLEHSWSTRHSLIHGVEHPCK